MVVAAHVDALAAQVARILADGVAQGAFSVPDTLATARAVLDATARFHNPVHAPEWSDARTGEAFEGVWRLILSGIAAPDRSA
jgi:hypothetical protein